jgi:hypothetical protein
MMLREGQSITRAIGVVQSFSFIGVDLSPFLTHNQL